jgi:hypothetical protein
MIYNVNILRSGDCRITEVKKVYNSDSLKTCLYQQRESKLIPEQILHRDFHFGNIIIGIRYCNT